MTTIQPLSLGALMAGTRCRATDKGVILCPTTDKAAVAEFKKWLPKCPEVIEASITDIPGEVHVRATVVLLPGCTLPIS